jgi:hypothetical protein
LLATIILDNNRLTYPEYRGNYIDFELIFVNISILKDLNDSFVQHLLHIFAHLATSSLIDGTDSTSIVIMLIMAIVTQQSMHLNQRLSDMTDIFNLVLVRAALDHIDRLPMLGQWVLLYVRTYVLEKQNPTSHKVLHLGLQGITIFHVMSGSTGMIYAVKLRLVPPLGVSRYSGRVSWSD